MTVNVFGYWSGRHFGFHLDLPDGRRFRIRADGWTRKTASEALDLLEIETGASRKNIRFNIN